MDKKGTPVMLQKMDKEQVQNVYENHMKKDFPADELKPLSFIFTMMERGVYDCLGFYEGGELKAYAFFVMDFRWQVGLLDYLAVCEPYRGVGIGGKCLTEMKVYYKDKKGILLECEKVEKAKDMEETRMRKRRIEFYVGNGCVETKVCSRLFGVEFTILYLPVREAKIEVFEELDRVYREMFPEPVYQKNVWVSASPF